MVYESAVDLAREIPLVGEALGILGDTAGKVVGAFFTLTNSAIQRGKELSYLSAELSVAGAQADVRKLMGDIKESQELGPSLAQLTDGQSRLDNTLREILLPIKKWVMEKLAGIMDRLADYADRTHKAIVGMLELMRGLQEAMKAYTDGGLISGVKNAGKVLAELPERIAKAMAKVDEEKFEPMPWEVFFDKLQAAQPGVGPLAPGGFVGFGGVNIPVLKGI